MANKSANSGKTVVIYVKWITRNGKRVYPSGGKKAFRLEIPRDKYRG